MSMVPTKTMAPGASSQPAEIRARSGMGVHRLHWGQRGVSGLGQDSTDPNAVLDLMTNTDPLAGMTTVDPSTTSYTYNTNTYNTTATPASLAAAGMTPAQITSMLGGATSGLVNVMAMANGGSIVTNPNGTQTVIGSGTTAAQAAATAASSSNPLASLSTMIVPIGVLALGFMLISSMGGKR